MDMLHVKLCWDHVVVWVSLGLKVKAKIHYWDGTWITLVISAEIAMSAKPWLVTHCLWYETNNFCQICWGSFWLETKNDILIWRKVNIVWPFSFVHFAFFISSIYIFNKIVLLYPSLFKRFLTSISVIPGQNRLISDFRGRKIGKITVLGTKIIESPKWPWIHIEKLPIPG